MNNKGFMMAELVVVSAIILVALVGLYASYNKIFSIYNQRISYYDVTTLYELSYIKDNIDFSTVTPSTNDMIFSDDGSSVYYIDKHDIMSLNVTNQTYKEYLEYLSSSLDFDNMTVNGSNVTNILVMEKCNSDGKTNCKYAYLEVPDEETT